MRSLIGIGTRVNGKERSHDSAHLLQRETQGKGITLRRVWDKGRVFGEMGNTVFSYDDQNETVNRGNLIIQEREDNS